MVDRLPAPRQRLALPRKVINDTMGDVPAAERALIIAGNAVRIFGLVYWQRAPARGNCALRCQLGATPVPASGTRTTRRTSLADVAGVGAPAITDDGVAGGDHAAEHGPPRLACHTISSDEAYPTRRPAG